MQKDFDVWVGISSVTLMKLYGVSVMKQGVLNERK